MSVEVLSGWLLSVMVATIPPGISLPKRAPAAQYVNESAAAGKARYQAIAKTIAQIALDPKEAPLFDGPRGRAQTAALLLTIAYHESHWRRDVDLGLGPQSRGGGGRYHCMMQIGVPKGKTPEGWTPTDLVKNREACFRRGLHMLQFGRKRCAKTGPRAFLNLYASGYCTRGRKPVNKRWRSYEKFLKKHPLPKIAWKTTAPVDPQKP